MVQLDLNPNQSISQPPTIFYTSINPKKIKQKNLHKQNMLGFPRHFIK